MIEHADNRREYLREHAHCAICYGRGEYPRPLSVHHICGRCHPQADTPANWLTLCAACHTGLHHGYWIDDLGRWPLVTPGMILTAKAEADGLADVEWLALLRYRKHLGYEPEPLTEWHLARRESWTKARSA